MRESVKHRLIGAAVLAAVAVLFLPSFFKDRQQYQVDTGSHIPGRPSITAVDFNEPESVDEIEPAPVPETMFVPDEADALELTQQDQEPVSSSAVSFSSVPQQPVAEASMLAEGWVIQVASLSAQDGANKLRDQLQAQGQRAYVRAVVLEKGTIYRVFIGPKQTREEASAVKQAVDKDLKVNSIVLPFKP